MHDSAPVDTTAPHAEARPPSMAIMEMATGYWAAQAICTAAILGLADRLADGPMDVGPLAAAVGADPEATYRLLRALGSIGVFAPAGERRFANTPLSDCLRSDAPGSMRNAVMMMGTQMHWRTWGELTHAVRTGKTPLNHVFGVDNPFTYFGKHPEEGHIFHNAMTDISRTEIPLIVGAYDFTGVRTLVDVGGNQGSLLASFLKANPGLQGVLFDVPDLVAGAAAGPLGSPELAGRWKAVGGDFFTSVPEGGDAYILKNVLDDWDDARCTTILRNIRKAMAPNGRVLVVDFLVRSEPGLDIAKWVDLNMLLVTDGGRERTEAEFAALLAAGGFTLTRVVPTPLPIVFVEGRPKA